jgi:hypothetical protein
VCGGGFVKQAIQVIARFAGVHDGHGQSLRENSNPSKVTILTQRGLLGWGFPGISEN